MTMGGFSASPPSSTIYSRRFPSTTQYSPCHRPFVSHRLCSSNFKLKPFTTRFAGGGGGGVPSNISLRCNCSTTPGGPGPGPGDNDSRSVLDAFFLGKALAEALNDRIESTLGEFLSAVGRVQAEQQKQVQDFQEEVLERAKRAKEKAAREAMEAQGLIPKPSTANASAVVDGDNAAIVPSDSVTTTPEIPPTSSNSSAPNVDTDTDPNYKDPPLGVSNEG